MNIFSTDIDPKVSANNLDDLRVNKMITESVQILANAIAHYGGLARDLPQTVAGTPYRTTAWQSHPSVLWVKESRDNYEWVLEHLRELINVFQKRRGTLHVAHTNLSILTRGAFWIPTGPLTPFANCTPYRAISDTVEAYRMTMAYKWIHDAKQPKWTNTVPPKWFDINLINQASTAAVAQDPVVQWTWVRLSRANRPT